MLFLILNKNECDPYITKDEILPIINHVNDIHYNYYSELYKEVVHINWLDEAIYIISTVCSLFAIYYLIKEINKSFHHVA